MAHLGYFHDEFVKRRKWLDEHAFADLVALCQSLPGPASSQVGLSIGLLRAGLPGALAAWTGFTLPSAIAMTLFAIYSSRLTDAFGSSWLHGLKLAAVAVVAQAVWTMARKLSRGKMKVTITIAAAALMWWSDSPYAQLAILFFAGVFGWIFLNEASLAPHLPLHPTLRRSTAASILMLFFVALFALPVLAGFSSNPSVMLFDRFFRTGALVFGGGHVVLPLLKSELVDTGWISSDAFMMGYGAAQAIPGPLFTFAAYLGAILMGPGGAILCLIAIFLPSFFLIFGALPFWEGLRRNQTMRSAMTGINAAVVGLLLCAFINPVCSSALHQPKDYIIASLALALLSAAKLPSWSVVIFSVCASLAV